MSLTGIRIALPFLLAACTIAAAQSAEDERRLVEGRTLRTAGRYAEAAAVFTALLRDAEKNSPGSVFVPTILDDLAQTEQDLGNLMAAERLLARSLEIRKEVTTESHLGELYLEEGRLREAEVLLRHVLEARQNATPPDAEDTAIALADLAMVYKGLGNGGQAESLLRKSLAILEEHFGPDHPMLSAALGPLGLTLTGEGKYREALAVTQRTWRILRQDPRVGEPDLINTMSSLGRLYALTNQFPEAEFYGKQAVEKAEAIYGPSNPRFGYHLANYARILRRMGRKAEAKEAQRRSEAILARSKQDNPVRNTVNVNALR